MKMRIGYLALGLLWAGSLYAQTAPDARWAMLDTLKGGKHGNLILIQPALNAENYPESERCRLVSVGANTLTCAMEHNRKHQFVVKLEDVQAIYQITKEGEHHPVLTIVGGLLGFGLGGGISDGGTDWPLAIIGAVIGSSFGIVEYLNSRHEVTQLVYVHWSPLANISSLDNSKTDVSIAGNSTAGLADSVGP
jgi:hypothetical protein